VELILSEAFGVLETVGVLIENDAALELLSGAGARVADDGQRVFIPQDLCERSLGSVSGGFGLYDRQGDHLVRVGGDEVRFVPGSAATLVYDYDDGVIRRPDTADVIDFVALTGQLSAFDLQSTGIVPGDVPEGVADRYRLFLALAYGTKPVITGTFTKAAFATMVEMLTAVRGSVDALREKPLAVFDCCPTSPLAWSDLTAQALIDCAYSGVPANLVPAPLIGATSPVTLSGTLVQHTAENLSGVVLHQAAAPGAPLMYGGAATVFDMRKGTAPMSGIEAAMVDAGYVQIGKHLGLPTHAYMGLSDAKTPDYQAGLETTLGASMAALCGVNVAAGGGLLNYVNCQSLEKLVLDNEACLHAQRLTRGIQFREGDAGADVIGECAPESSFLTSAHTRKHFRDEVYYPDPVIDRVAQGDWEADGSKSAAGRAHEKVLKLRATRDAALLETEALKELENLMLRDAKAVGMERLPDRKAR
jgi:trimethylamine--corrinoid protein Co-methyltransferase